MLGIDIVFIVFMFALIALTFLWAIKFKPLAKAVIAVFGIEYSDQYCEDCGMRMVVCRVTSRYTTSDGEPVYKDKTECIFDHGYKSSNLSAEYLLIDGKRKPYISPEMERVIDGLRDTGIVDLFHNSEEAQSDYKASN